MPGFVAQNLATLLSSAARWVQFQDGSRAPASGSIIIDPLTGLPIDLTAATPVAGPVADGANYAGAPLPISGRTDGAKTKVARMADTGEVMVVLRTPTGTAIAATASSSDAVPEDTIGVTARAFAYAVDEATGNVFRRLRASVAGLLTTIRPDTAGGLTQGRLSGAAASGVLKAAAGQVYGHSLFNANAATRFLQLYNKATPPTVGTDAVIRTIPLGPGVNPPFANPMGLSGFPAGLAWAITTDAAGTVAGAATDVIGMVDFK